MIGTMGGLYILLHALNKQKEPQAISLMDSLIYTSSWGMEVRIDFPLVIDGSVPPLKGVAAGKSRGAALAFADYKQITFAGGT